MQNELRTPEQLTAEKSEHIINIKEDFGKQDFDFTREAAENEEHYKLLENVFDAIQIAILEETNELEAAETSAENVQALKNLAVLSAGIFELVLGEPKPSFATHALYSRLNLTDESIEDTTTPGKWNLKFNYNTKGQKQECGLEVGIYPTAREVFRQNGIPGDVEFSIPAMMEIVVWLPDRPAITVMLKPGRNDVFLGTSIGSNMTENELELDTTAETFAGSMRLMKRFLQHKAGQSVSKQSISTIR